MDLKSLPAIAALERVVKTLKLTLDDQKRCGTLVKLLKTSADGRLRYDAVLDAVFPADHRPTNPKNVFTKFRQRVAAVALDSGETFSIDVSGSKRSTTAAMLVTFTGDDAAAGSLTLPANPHYRIADYAEQRAALPIKPIFLSNADADATLVAEFVNCLNTTLSSDPDERVRDWAHASWWHRKDLNQNLPHESMQRAINECTVGILLFSRDLLASDYVRTDELPRFDPRKLQNTDPLARDAIAVRLTSESVSKIHAVVGHEAFQLIGWVSPDSKTRLSFEESTPRQRENICDKVVAELKRILLPKPVPKSPVKSKRRLADSDAPTKPQDDHRLDLPPHKDYAVGNYYDAQTAMTGRVLRAGTSNLLQLQPSPTAEDATDDAQPAKQVNVAALAHLTAWATQPTSTRWFAVLGELGMGKTYLCRMLECQLKADKTAPRAIYIDLKASADDAAANRALTLESIIGNSLRSDYNQPKHITVDTVLDWVRKQGAIAIFDGLDELAVHLKDEGTRALITELLRVLPPQAEPIAALNEVTRKKNKSRPAAPGYPGKVVISCRTHYFPDIASESAFLLQAHRGTMNQHDVESFTLLPFTEEAIRRFFTQALGAASADHAFELITDVHNLRELAERPYLLRLITAQIDRLEDFRKRGQTVNASTLYGLFAADWLQRDTGKHEFDASDKPTVMQALAAEMWREGARQWSHARLKTWLYTLIERTPGWSFRYSAKADVLAKDLRTATFLVRAGESDFRFAHTSLQEYFLSGYLLDALLEGAGGAATRWHGLAPSSETVDFMWQRWQLLDAASQRRASDAFRALLALRPSAAIANKPSATAPLSAWLKYVVLQPDNPTAEINVAGIVDSDFALVGGERRPLRLPGLNLDDAQLPSAHMTHVNAPRLHAIGSDLRQSRWLDADVSHADFTGANLRGSTWQNVSLPGAIATGAAFDGALLQGCDVSGVAFSQGMSPIALINPASMPSDRGFVQQTVSKGLEAIVATGNHAGVKAVAFSPDGKTLASGSDDGTVIFWDAISGRERARLRGHQGFVHSVAFSPDGRLLVSGSADATIRLWDVRSSMETHRLLGHASGVRVVVFSSDGATIASACDDTLVKLWSVASGAERRSLAGHRGRVIALAFRSDNLQLASGSEDKTVKLWNVGDGLEIQSFGRHGNEVNFVAFDPSGSTLLAGSLGHEVSLWDTVTGSLRARWRGDDRLMQAAALSPDGRTLATGGWNGDVTIWDVSTSRKLRSFAGNQLSIHALAFNPTGTILASGCFGGTIMLRSVTSDHDVTAIPTHKAVTGAVAFSPDGQKLVCGGSKGLTRSWSLARGQEAVRFAMNDYFVASVAISPDGNTVATASSDATIRLFDMQSGSEIKKIAGHQDVVSSIAFSPDGKTLASGSNDDTVKLWDAASGRQLPNLTYHSDSVHSVAFSPDGKTLASGSGDHTIVLWDTVERRVLRTLTGHTNSVRSVCFSPDGKWLASGSVDKTIKLWDAATGREVHCLAGHKNWVRSVTFSPDGKTLATGSMDNTIKLWDLPSGIERLTLHGHNDWVLSVSFSPDGRTLASGSGDNAVKLWDVSRGRELRSHVSLPRGEWAVLDAPNSSSKQGGTQVINASEYAPQYLRQHWRNPATGELDWMPWVPPDTQLWVKYQ